MTTHTPGPWTFHGDGMERMRDDGKTPARSYCIYSGNTETGKNLFNVAEACIPMGKKWGHEETQANARLIAAAPELLEALKSLVNICTHPQATKADMKRIALEARAAIAKAKGE